MGDKEGPTLDDIMVVVMRHHGELVAYSRVWGNEVGRVAMPVNEVNEYDRRSEVAELAARAYDAASAHVHTVRGGKPHDPRAFSVQQPPTYVAEQLVAMARECTACRNVDWYTLDRETDACSACGVEANPVQRRVAPDTVPGLWESTEHRRMAEASWLEMQRARRGMGATAATMGQPAPEPKRCSRCRGANRQVVGGVCDACRYIVNG